LSPSAAADLKKNVHDYFWDSRNRKLCKKAVPRIPASDALAIHTKISADGKHFFRDWKWVPISMYKQNQ
jgi:hypothetical protein